MKKHIEQLTFLIGSIAILVIAIVLSYDNEILSLNIGRLSFISGYQCPIYSVFHIPCPTCGLTRAFVLFAHFNFIEAYRYNASVFVLYPYFLLQIPMQIIDIIRTHKNVGNSKLKKINLYLLIAIGILLIVIWVLKLTHVLPIL